MRNSVHIHNIEDIMANDAGTAGEMNKWLKARGYICGRQYANVGDLARGIEANVRESGESLSDVERRVKRLMKTPGFGFKSKDDAEISASDDKCG